MRFTSVILIFSILLGAATLSLVAANVAVRAIESNSEINVGKTLQEEGLDWVLVEADGLQVKLSGTAPSEATRFRALTVAGTIVDAHRVVDLMSVKAAEAIAAPRFSVEILRNDSGISLIGLIPEGEQRETIVQRVSDLTSGGRVADMLETAEHDVPEGWNSALDYAIEALSRLPRSKISVSARLVTITATSDSREERVELERRLLSRVPNGLEVVLNISAPRPVITPFTLRFVIKDGEGRFDACAADTEFTRVRILNAASAASVMGNADCVVGLGNPSPHWGSAAVTAIEALSELGAGSVTFSDADVTLVGDSGTSITLFERVSAELETDLPAAFSLHLVKPEGADSQSSEGPPEFTATRSPEGLVQLRGRITDERTRNAVNAFALSQFGAERVYMATNLDPELPDGWPLRVLAGVEVLGHLSSGGVTIEPDLVKVHGLTGDPEASATISRVLSAKLGEAQAYSVDVAYKAELDPVINLPSPEECVEGINQILAESKLTFAPGSADFEAGAGETLNKIADMMKECQNVAMEIAGHTDSQGREEMNLNLSQSRANAVLNALMSRRVLTSSLVAQGYGETTPIADNGTEEGREANRRIEFTLIAEDAEEEAPSDESPTEGTEEDEQQN